MLIHFALLRDGVTSTSVNLDVDKLDVMRRWILSSLRGSGLEAQLYHFMAVGNLQDISGTDTLEEITGTVTGVSYSIVNLRNVTGSHMEFDLEPIHD